MKKQNPSLELLATERALKTVTACNMVLVRAKSEPEMLRNICHTVIEQTGYRMAWIGFPEMDERKSMRVVACAGFEDGYLEKANITWREDDERGQGPSGVSYRTGKIVVSNNFQKDPITGPWREEAKARGYNSSISMPLKHNEECFGMMMIYAEHTDAFQDRERQLLAGLADDISYGIHTMRVAQRHNRAEAENARLLAIIEESSDFIGIADIHGNLLYQNRAGRKMVGLAEDASLTGMTIRSMQPEWAAKMVIEKGIPIVLEKGNWRAETALLHQNGTVIPVSQIVVAHRDASNQLQFLSTIIRDITERKQAEQKILALNADLERRVMERTQRLAETEARMRFALGVSHIGVWDLNLEDHTAVRSLEHDQVFGYTELLPEWTFQDFLKHVLPEDQAEVERKFRCANETQTEWDFECRIKRLDGEIRWIWAIGKFNLIDENQCHHMNGIVQDITDRKRAEIEIAKLNEGLKSRSAELEAANQELEAFSYSVSHDLRAPLRAIDGFSRILQEDYSDQLDEPAKEKLRRVRAASQHMGQLIDDLLQLAHYSRSVLQRTPVNLSALICAAAEELQTQAPDRKVEFVIASDLQAIADPGLIRVVLTNLLENAWKFTSKTTAARIELGRTIIDGIPTFFVRDNGAGFDMAYADKLFGVFQRLHTTSEFPGTGIGLTIIQRIIHRHGGRIWAEGQVNQGATFYFTIPDSLVSDSQKNIKIHENQY